MNNNYILEANRITNYLISVPLEEQERNRYVQAMDHFDIQLKDYEIRLLSTMLKSKWRMSCIDAGLAIKDPNNAVRRKIFTMLAILEASPTYTKYFLSKHFSFLYFIKIGWIGLRSVVRAIIGIILIKNIQSKCN
ncbi:hypothetical protein [uncultured Aquimarina sp.]|uniref:hypothetical protein n=1 Tax=uncultured Aquimarina sp. TaxID=575652 RepID=UPI0026252A48|nr:hypothetical protein [uncultured Aquimarina sp.]